MVPSLDEWIAMPDALRARVLNSLNPYAGEGAELVESIAARFRDEFGDEPGLRITGAGVYHGGTWVIGITHPLIFDRRRVPARYLGIEIRASVHGDLPLEFQTEDVWSPSNYERFVTRCAEEIRVQLGDANMSTDEMLYALIGMPFQSYLALYRDRK